MAAFISAGVFALILCFASPCSSAQNPGQNYTSPTYTTAIADANMGMQSVPELNMTYAYMNETNVIRTFANQTAATFLLPWNASWSTVPANIKSLLAGPNGKLVLTNLLLFHIIPQYRSSDDFQGTDAYTALPTLLGNGQVIYFIPVDGQNFFYTDKATPKTNATDIGPDTFTDEIISIQEIDRVLIPQNLSTLLTPQMGLFPVQPPAPAPAPAPTPPSTAPPPTTPAPPPSSTPSPPPSTTPASPSPSAPAPAPKGAYAITAVDMRVVATAGVTVLAALLL